LPSADTPFIPVHSVSSRNDRTGFSGVVLIKFLEGCLREKGVKITKIILFGSQITGKATEESDLDIVIISEDFKGKDIFKRAELTKEAEIMTIKKFMIPLDIITLTPEEFESGTSLIAEYARKEKYYLQLENIQRTNLSSICSRKFWI
jgi:predicted nucleotidyltransferase